MNKNIIIGIIAGAIITAGGSFYVGMKYRPTINRGTDRQARVQQFGGARGQRGSGEGFVSGEILSMDDKSVTIKLQDGGSKIIFFSDGTPISKMVTGAAQDLETGKQITVMGSANQDGSVSAQSIQVRPPMPAR